MHRRKRIALILRSLDEQYQISVYKAVSHRARELNIDLVCIQENAGRQGPGSEQTEHNFSLAWQFHLDGILILTSVTSEAYENRLKAGLPEHLAQIPCLSVGYPLENMCSIDISSRRSMRRLMEHLTGVHRYRRFLFIGGFPGHHDSTLRQAVFQEVLAQAGHQDPQVWAEVEYGHFLEETAFRLVRDRIRREGEPLDAIVAANDNMALGALKALRLENNPAWAACAVTGFDDIPQAATEIPSLTSIHQPLDQLGHLAVDTLLRLIQGEGVPKIQRIESQPVIRESCGCPPQAREEPPESQTLRLARIQRQNLESERRLSLVNTLGQNLTEALDLDSILEELDRFLDNLGVTDCYLLMNEGFGSHSPLSLVYDRKDEHSNIIGSHGLPMNMETLLGNWVAKAGQPMELTMHYLQSGGETLGMLAYEAPAWAHPFMCTLAVHVANTTKRVQVLQGQAKKARQLEQEVGSRTRDLQLSNRLLEQEVNRRTNVEAELRHQQSNLETILDAMPLPLIVYHHHSGDREDGRILYTNKAFTAFSSLSVHGGTRIQDFLDIPEGAENLELSFKLGDDLHDDIPVLFHAAPIFFEKRQCHIASLVDLRWRKVLEADILRISEYERRRFGLDLHDDICQRLAGLGIYSKLIAGRLEAVSPGLGRSLDDLSQMLDETLSKTRIYAHASFPVELQNFGLDPVLRDLCDQVATQTGLDCQYHSDLADRESPFRLDQDINIYRIVQEALQNAAKHAQARQIAVTLVLDSRSFSVRIADDGIGGLAPEGLDPQGRPLRREPSTDHGPRLGMGFRSMGYRASQLGARLWIEARPGGGTVICLELSLPR